jgi:hypothetical protein
MKIARAGSGGDLPALSDMNIIFGVCLKHTSAAEKTNDLF